ncbi:MAG TPA: glycosyltransferase family 4 protein [Candidatus Eisenbacteria bacterium]|nr:glycosyltransferase family 4 protein [Candidatus Eisenbacteria bacterium]
MTRKPAGASRSLRVLHLDSERTWRGGERQVLELMRRQRGMGDEPHLAAPAGSAIATRAAAEGIPVHPVAMRGTWDAGSVAAVAKLHRSIRPHVAHWHAARAHAIGALAALLAPGPARVLSRRVDFPVRRSPGSRLLYSLPIDAILAISEGVRQALLASGVPDSLIRVVPSGIDLAPHARPRDRAAIRAREGLAEGEILVLQVAALAPHKSQHDLLRAARAAIDRRPELRFWIAGEGALRGELERERDALSLGDRVRFLGFREDVFDLLAAADLFCVSSYLEGMGTSTLDAMAAGLAVVATRVGGIPEIVEDGVTGVLVEPRDPEALARALAELAGDGPRRERMGEEARIKVRDFSADRTAERTRRAYDAALARLTQ